MGLCCGGFVKRIIIIGIYKVNLQKLTLYFVLFVCQSEPEGNESKALWCNLSVRLKGRQMRLACVLLTSKASISSRKSHSWKFFQSKIRFVDTCEFGSRIRSPGNFLYFRCWCVIGHPRLSSSHVDRLGTQLTLSSVSSVCSPWALCLLHGRALRDDTKNTAVSTEIPLELRSLVRLVSVTELQVRRKLLYFPPDQ